MARIFTSGAELNSTTANVEFTSVTNATISSGTVRTGTYAININAAGVATTARYQYVSGNTSAGFYARCYVNIASMPTGADCQVLQFNNVANNSKISIRLTTGSQFQLYNEEDSVAIGSNSSSVSTNTWYRLELKVDTTTLATTACDARLDGTSFASGNANLTTGIGVLQIGTSSASPTANFYVDDIALNDTSGTYQNAWPGSGQVIHLYPNATGDNNAWATQTGGTAGSANNYTRVNEITPDDSTTMNADNTTGRIDDFNIDDTPSGITASSQINVISVNRRWSASGATASGTVTSRIKAAASGTTDESSAVSISATTWQTNTTGVPRTPPVIVYDMPGATTNSWLKGDLDSAQIGYKLSAAGSSSARISTTWAAVDYRTITGTIAYDSRATGRTSSATAGSPLTYSHTAGSDSNRLLLLGITIQDSNHANMPITAVTYGGVSCTKLRSDEATGDNRSEIWYLVNPASGSNTVSVTPTGSVGELACCSLVLTGVAQSAPEANSGTNGSSATPSRAVTNIATDAWVFGVLSAQDVPTPSSGQTQYWYLQDQSFENSAGGMYPECGAAASQTMSWSLASSQSWALSVCTIAPYVAGASTGAASWPVFSGKKFWGPRWA